ncbi:MAG: hypothetical protein ACFE8B_17180 [Candidatus Hermodarchaeota archaeon]
MLVTTRSCNPLRTGLLLFLIITAIYITYFPVRAANEPSEIDYYLTKDRWDDPDYRLRQFKLKSEIPTGSESYQIKHPNNFIWRTDFQPSGLNFSSGHWTFNLWFETNETNTCKLSLGLLTKSLGYIPITEPKTFTLDQTAVQKYNFTLENVDAFTVPEGGCFAVQINATLANLYLDSQNQPSNVHYSLQIIATTSTTTTTDFITTQTQVTFTSQSTSEPISPPTTATTLTRIQTSTPTIIGENHFSLIVHAHPQEIEYPSEPPSELKVKILVDYQIDGIRKTEIKETLFFLEVDKNTDVALNLSSYPTDFIWVEWDNYGLGRTRNTTILIQMDTNRNAIAYFLNTSYPITTSTNPEVTVVVVPGFSDLSIIVGFLCAAAAILLTRITRYQYFKR